MAKKKAATRKAAGGAGTKRKSARKTAASPTGGATRSGGRGGADADEPSRPYVVMARRYRPQQFGEVIGQQAVADALTGAIEAGRVAHAYLFTGSRGVGKTSMARILAKALNCAEGPTARPCDQCEICRAIISGDDVDVLEIDGASNRGIDEIRELRQNVGYRPSRTRYKVYIIDEVHMLTREAFNALLKTLEEPPPHVKFVFCTTEPHKIPITILSRCQRFDFGPVSSDAIVERLRQIVEAEQVEAESEALEAIARRAAGSMRDSQSLLDQVLAFGGKQVTAGQIHQLLGTATEELVFQLGSHLLEGHPAPALEAMQAAVGAGVQVEQLTDQLIDYFRDLMVARYPGPEGPSLHSISAQRHEQMQQQSSGVPLANTLAAIQILLDAKARMRGSTYAQTLAELALVRIATLEDLDELAGIVRNLEEPSASARDGRDRPALHRSVPSAQKKTPPLSAVANSPATPPAAHLVDAPSSEELPSLPTQRKTPALSAPSPADLPRLWNEALALCDDLFLREQAARADRLSLGEEGQLVVSFGEQYNYARNFCARPEKLVALQAALARIAGRPLTVLLESCPAEPAEPAQQPASYKQRLAESSREPLVRKVQDVFQATIVRVDDAPGSAG